MDEKVQATVRALSDRLRETNAAPYTIDVADPSAIKLLDKNARYMSHEMFENLVQNIKRDGGLSSLPLCYRDPDGSLLVLSGNHRVQAAAQAGIKQILVMVIDRELTREEQVAVQLSHNAIDGKDDPLMLKKLWDEIKQIDLKFYAGLDSETIKELEKIQFVSISEARLEYKEIKLLFLPEQTATIKELMKDLDALFSSDEYYLLSRAHYDEVFNLLLDVKDKYNIVNSPTAFMKIVELARKAIEAESTSKTVPEQKAPSARSRQ
jgi:hypothetical protein